MKRREFMMALGGAATAWPLAARAQQSAMPVIGFLASQSRDNYVSGALSAFRQGLYEIGYVEGRSLAIEYRWGDDHYDRLPELVADLIRRRVNVIAANALSARVAQAATSTIPIVFYTGADPVRGGLVSSLNRPGGNTTGVTILADDVVSKRLELLHELVPTAGTIAALINPTDGPRSEIQHRDLQTAARTLGLHLRVLHASSERDYETAFESWAQMGAGGLVICGDPFFTSRSERLAKLAGRHAIPTIYQYRDFAAAGGLLSYGGSRVDGWRLVGNYTGRILKGEKPADLPVQQSTRVELTINLKTAKALGLTVPLSLRSRADEVIE